MTFRWAVLILVLVSGCSRPREDAHAEHAEEGEEHAHAEEAPGGEGLLEIDPEMLRDLRVTTTAAVSRMGGEEARLLGELQANHEAYAEVSAPIDATVERLAVQPGDRVRAGGVLAELRSPELGRARASVLAAEARLQLAQQALARKQALAAERIAPRREVEEAEAEATTAAAELAAARSTVRAMGAEGGEGGSFLLRSPIAGSVLERRGARGRMATPAEPLFTVGDLSTLWLIAHGFERDALRIPVGAPAEIGFAALPGRTFGGKVAAIGTAVDAGSRTLPIRIEVGNEGSLLRPGMSATARVPLGGAGQAVVVVPAAALQRLSQSWCVFVPRGAGKFEVRAVGRGRDLGGDVEVLNGLAAGESVVLDGAFLLKAEVEKSRGEGEEHAH
ncbi:MAG TPA: efflux RND transporter periplasmic adaptor subunit [Candidatus Polarisedimenticolaceae bacterium]|nr:efflux RND transporter periplasmic adaptor subunit [Candidatus Polarisedimenticolaceae bacterium]